MVRNLKDESVSRGNGGFYPEQPIAAYKQTFISKLRSYDRLNVPSEYCRPKSTKQARLNSKSIRKPTDHYLMSQSFYIADKSLVEGNRKLR